MIPKRYLAAVVAALLGAAQAPAAAVDWSYEVTVTPTVLNSGSEPSVGFLGLTGTGSGTSQVGAVQVSTFGVGFPGEGTFDPTVQLFTVDFNLKDTASNQSQVLTYQGGVGGIINQSGANLQFGFSEPSTHVVTLGENSYEVSLLPLTVTQEATEGAPQSEDLPSIMAQVNVLDVQPEPDPGPTPEPPPTSNPPPVLDTPEPASLSLAGLGAAALGLWAYRGRRLLKVTR